MVFVFGLTGWLSQKLSRQPESMHLINLCLTGWRRRKKERELMSLSIGTVGGMRFDGISDRWKGIASGIAENARRAKQILGENIVGAAPGGTRFTMRMFVGAGVRKLDLKEIRALWGDATVRMEAFIPVGAKDVGGIAYFGGCTSLREGFDASAAKKEVALLRKVGRKRTSNHAQVPEGFRVELLDPKHIQDCDIEDLVAMYLASYTQYITAFTCDSVRAMCEENMVAVARNGNGNVVAVSQGEVAEIPFAGIRLVEISETATNPAYRSMGLTTHCKLALIAQLRSPETLIYAESRANWGGVIRQNLLLGMGVSGWLDRHCVIAAESTDVPQAGKYGDLFVFNLPMNHSV